MTSSTANTPAGEPSASLAQESVLVERRRGTRLLVLGSAGIGFALVWWLGRLLGVPVYWQYSASLLQQPGAASITAVLLALLGFSLCAVIGQLIAGRHWLFAGIFAGAAAYAALSTRGGPIHYVYLQADSTGQGRGVFFSLALETVLLFVPIAALWSWIGRRRPPLAPPAVPGKPSKPAPPPGIDWRNAWQGVVTQISITGFLVVLFTSTDQKFGVLAWIFLASLIGTGVTEHFFKADRLWPLYWAGPLMVAVLGYVLYAFFGDVEAALKTGRTAGAFSSLARALPLDYAAAGATGALLGLWLGSEHPELYGGMTVREVTSRPGIVDSPAERQ